MSQDILLAQFLGIFEDIFGKFEKELFGNCIRIIRSSLSSVMCQLINYLINVNFNFNLNHIIESAFELLATTVSD